MVAGLGKIAAKATNTLKNVAASAAKKTTRKTDRLSDKAYNARRRAKRKLERELKKTNKNQQTIEQLRAEIQQSYATRQGEYLVDIEQFERRSKKYTATYERELVRNKSEIARKNEMMKHEINQASVGGVSKYKQEAVKVFYAATQKIWQGRPQGTWNEAIMEHYGVDTFHEAWMEVFSDEAAKEALRQARKNRKQLGSDADMPKGSSDEKDEKGSPEYIKDFILILDTR